MNNMDSKTLIDAIRFHDPDGKGIERVKQAANLTISEGLSAFGKTLWCHDPDFCIFAHAWKARSVDSFTFKRYNVTFPHDYKDIIHWFDGLTNGYSGILGQIHASRTVLFLLENTAEEIDEEEDSEDSLYATN